VTTYNDVVHEANKEEDSEEPDYEESGGEDGVTV
jgi:hypothetical protein